MSKFVDFPESILSIGAEECETIRVLVEERFFQNEPTHEFTSCVQFTDDEIRKIIDNDNRIYVTTTGRQPPIRVGVMIPETPKIEWTWQELADRCKSDPMTVNITFSETDHHWNIKFDGLVFWFTEDQMESFNELLFS